MIEGRVSVVIPTYKRTDMLTRAIDSVLEQSYDNIECIVVSDNEPGDDYAIKLKSLMKKYEKCANVILMEQEHHTNGAVARNFGAEKAEGEFLAFLDDDDWWNPKKIELQVARLRELGDSYGAVGCLTLRYTGDELIHATLPYKEGYILKDVLENKIKLKTSSMLMRKNVFIQAGGFDPNLKRCQDLQLFAYVANVTNISLVKLYLDNADVDDRVNMPKSAEAEFDIQMRYFDSISPLLQKFDNKEVKKIKNIKMADYAYALWNLGEKRRGVFEFIKAVHTPSVTFLFLRKVYVRIVTRKFKYSLINRYSLKDEN